MRPFGRAISAGALLLFGAAPALWAQDSAEQAAASASRFATEFYAWYVPLAREMGEGPSWARVLRLRAAALTPELFRALSADAEAQAIAGDEIVGLDHDPFLNSQDPCERYEVGPVRRTGTAYLVEIYGVCSGERHRQPDVVAELVQADGAWVIANFRASDGGGDLLSVLRRLHEARGKGS